MSGRQHITVAKLAGNTAPVILNKRFTNGETFKIGAILIEDTATQGYVKEGATGAIADIHGIATEAVDSRPGFELGFASQVTQVTGRVQKVPMYVADSTTVFSGTGVSAAALTQVDLEYGLIKSADGIWRVDQTDTSNVAVKVIDVDVDNNIVYFRFLVSALPVGV